MTIRFKGFISLHTCMFPKLKYMFLCFVIALFVVFKFVLFILYFYFGHSTPQGLIRILKKRETVDMVRIFPLTPRSD